MTHAPLTWRKSTYSGPSGSCVEVAVVPATGAAGDGSTPAPDPRRACGPRGPGGTTALLRNSNRPGAGTLAVPAAALGAWIADARAGALDDLTC